MTSERGAPRGQSTARYDEIGRGYSNTRHPDPRIEQYLADALGDAAAVINVGAGSGSYELKDRTVVAMEPSAKMIAQRSSQTAPVAQAAAEALPVRDGAFDAGTAILTIHHWADRQAGYDELCRVAKRRIVLTYDPDIHHDLWIVRDYIPEIGDLDKAREFSVEEVVRGIGANRVISIPVPWDCTDGFVMAFWRRPEAYFDRQVRAGMSGFSLIDQRAVERGLAELDDDLVSGRWKDRYGDLLEADQIDAGLRLVIAD